jgi:hypothetical protein
LLAAADVTLDRQARCDYAIMAWRVDYDVKFRAIDALEHAALQAMQDSATFGDMCELAARQVGTEAAPLRAAQILRGWLEWSIVATVDHEGRGSAA